MTYTIYDFRYTSGADNWVVAGGAAATIPRSLDRINRRDRIIRCQIKTDSNDFKPFQMISNEFKPFFKKIMRRLRFMFPHSFGRGIGFGEFRSFSILVGGFRILLEKKCTGVWIRGEAEAGFLPPLRGGDFYGGLPGVVATLQPPANIRYTFGVLKWAEDSAKKSANTAM